MTRDETLRRLGREAQPYAPRLVVGMLLGTLAGLSNLVAPWAFKVLVDNVLTRRAQGANLYDFYLVLGTIFAALMFQAVAVYFQTYLMAWNGQHLIKKLRVRLFDRVMHLPLAEFDKWRPGELITRFSNDLQLMTDAVSISLPQLVVAAVTFVSSFAVMIKIDWLLTLVLIVVAPIVSIAVSRFQKLISSSTTGAQQRIADLSSNLTEALGAQRVIKAFNRESYETQRFAARNDRYFGTYMKLTQFIMTQPMVLTIIMGAAITLIIYLSVHEVVVARRLDTGEIFQYWLLLVNLVNPMNRFAAFVGDIEKALVGSSRVYEVLDLPVERADNPGAIPLPHVRGEIVFDHVCFTYGSAERTVIDDFSATIRAGETVALVGPSGAGKTTLVNMVPRFYEPQRGEILVDGENIADVRLHDLRAAIALVPQEPLLFRGTIADNVRYGRLDATDAQVRAAAREANAEEFISQFPDGYATEVGERGARLSGGQRQRISIARAILRDPRILILDEATSALDSHSEALIESALDRLLTSRTTLIIAHRLSTVRRAGRIVYIESGRLVETGTHEELVARGGAYAALHARQFAVSP